jgi:hypothetical protein
VSKFEKQILRDLQETSTIPKLQKSKPFDWKQLGIRTFALAGLIGVGYHGYENSKLDKLPRGGYKVAIKN